MTDYLVKWEIDVFDAESPREAAEKALATVRNPYAHVGVFSVHERPAHQDPRPECIRIDLTPPDGDVDLSEDLPN